MELLFVLLTAAVCGVYVSLALSTAAYRLKTNLHSPSGESISLALPKAPVWCPRHVGTQREIECTRAITPKMVQETIMRIPAFQKHVAEMKEQEILEEYRAKASIPGAVSTLMGFPPRQQKKKLR